MTRWRDVYIGLKDIPIKISYRSKGNENILDSFIIPAFKTSKIHKRSVVFSSSVFELTGDGVKEFASNGGEIRLICSPDLNQDDIETIKLGYK